MDELGIRLPEPAKITRRTLRKLRERMLALQDTLTNDRVALMRHRDTDSLAKNSQALTDIAILLNEIEIRWANLPEERPKKKGRPVKADPIT